MAPRGLFSNGCHWNSNAVQLEEKEIVSSCPGHSLTELNVVYVYDQNQEVILKNKADQELKG